MVKWLRSILPLWCVMLRRRLVPFAPPERLVGRFKLLGHGVCLLAIGYERIQVSRRGQAACRVNGNLLLRGIEFLAGINLFAISIFGSDADTVDDLKIQPPFLAWYRVAMAEFVVEPGGKGRQH